MEAGTRVGRGNSFQIKINAAAETTFMCPQQKRKPGGRQQAAEERVQGGGQLWDWVWGWGGRVLPWPHSANQNAMKVNSLEN